MRKWLGHHQEKKSEWPSGEEATTVVESEWRLEPEGEAEVPEIIIVSDAVEGTFVDLDGESHHEQVETKLSRRGREMLNEGEEIRSPKRKVIRVESEESQDHVREENSTEFEEEEERTFIPSAVSVPLKPLFRCHKQCSEKTLSCWQLAAVVLNEGDEAYTTNLCQKCFNKHPQAKGEMPLTNGAVETGGGKGAVSWKNVENDGERTISAWDVGIFSPRKKTSKEVSAPG